MARWRQVIKQLLFPDLRLVLLSVPIAAAGLVYVFSGRCRAAWLPYLIYVLSFCALVWVCARALRAAGHWQRDAAALLDRFPAARRYRSDAAFRTNVSLYCSLALNVLYALAKLAFGLYYRSVWFGTLAAYYAFLALMRFSLLRYAGRHALGADQRAEWRRYRLCGALLLLMSIVLTGIAILVVTEQESFHYAGYLIYVMALYAFYNVIAAIRNVAAYRAYHSPVMSAARALCLAAALVSMLALETAMLEQFGGSSTARFRTVMTGCTGGGVCILILGIAVYMLRRAAKQKNTLKTEDAI